MLRVCWATLTEIPESMDVIPSSQNEENEAMAVVVGDPPSESQAHPDTTVANAIEPTNLILTASERVESSQPVNPGGPSVVALTSQLERMAREPDRDRSPSSPGTTTLMSSLPGCTGSDTVSQLPETNIESQVTAPVDRHKQLGSSTSSAHNPSQPGTEETTKGLAVTGSNLSPKEMVLLRQFCKNFGASEHSTFLPGCTTHVVMRGEPDRPRVVIRTLKFFMGILNRSWIINLDWIRQCLAARVIVDESPFEIEGDTVCGDCHEGPRRSRLKVPALLHHPPVSGDVFPPALSSGEGDQQRPFTGLWLSAYGSLGLLSVKDFVELARSGGASRVFEKPADLAVAADLHAKSQTASQKPRAVILTDSHSSQLNLVCCKEMYRMYGVPVISIDWMLTCISLYRRIPIGPLYRICPPAPQKGETEALRPPLRRC